MKNKIKNSGLLFLIFLSSLLFGQENVEAKRLDIYAVNFYSLPIHLNECDLNVNHVRAKSIYSIRIKEINLINELMKTFLIVCKQNSKPVQEQFTSRLVFDFSKDEIVVFTISLNEFGEMILNEDSSRYYESNDLILGKIQEYFPFLGRFLKRSK